MPQHLTAKADAAEVDKLKNASSLQRAHTTSTIVAAESLLQQDRVDELQHVQAAPSRDGRASRLGHRPVDRPVDRPSLPDRGSLLMIDAQPRRGIAVGGQGVAVKDRKGSQVHALVNVV